MDVPQHPPGAPQHLTTDDLVTKHQQLHYHHPASAAIIQTPPVPVSVSQPSQLQPVSALIIEQTAAQEPTTTDVTTLGSDDNDNDGVVNSSQQQPATATMVSDTTTSSVTATAERPTVSYGPPSTTGSVVTSASFLSTTVDYGPPTAVSHGPTTTSGTSATESVVVTPASAPPADSEVSSSVVMTESREETTAIECETTPTAGAVGEVISEPSATG